MRLHLSAEMTFQDRNKKTHARRQYWKNCTKLPQHFDFGILVGYSYPAGINPKPTSAPLVLPGRCSADEAIFFTRAAHCTLFAPVQRL